MRDEVYLENQLYFQGVRGENSIPAAHELKIVESFERIPFREEEKNDNAEDEDFFEALPLIEEEINEVELSRHLWAAIDCIESGGQRCISS